MMNQSFGQNFDLYTEELNSLTFEMAPIPGGTFMMGSSANGKDDKKDEGPLHQVKVDSFWLATQEITWDLYDQFLNRNTKEETFPTEVNALAIEVDGISGASTPYIDMSEGMGKENYPVTNITQHAALSFCKWLSAKTGHFYRLPTEAEWEYTCKKGIQKDSTNTLLEQGWFDQNSPDAYQQVGQKKPNHLGIYDMLGNVAEWTMDQYSLDYYSKSSVENPWAFPEKLYPRTLRGGSWKDEANQCTCTARKKSNARWKRIDPQLPKSKWWFTNAPMVGFRILRSFKQPSPEEIKKYWLQPIDDF